MLQGLIRRKAQQTSVQTCISAEHLCLCRGVPGMPGLMYSCTFRYSPLVSCVEAITVYLYPKDILAVPSAELTLCSKNTWNDPLLECTRTVSAQHGRCVVNEKSGIHRTTVRLMPIALQRRLQPGLFSLACSFRGLRSDADTLCKVHN